MQKDPITQLKHMSDKIEDIEFAFAAKCITGQHLGWEDTCAENLLCILLRAPRLLLCAQQMSRHQQGYTATFLDDWQKIKLSLKSLWFIQEESDTFFADAAELIALTNPGLHQELLLQLNQQLSITVHPAGTVSDRVCHLALDMVAAGLDYGLKTESFSVIAHLLDAVSRRNSSLPELQRSVVHRSLFYTIDLDSELAYRICRRYTNLFEGESDLHACWFYWFYGVAALRLNHLKEAYPLLEHCHALFTKKEGPRSWIGIRAKVLYLFRSLEQGIAGTEAELWDILDKIEREEYIHMDDNAPFVAAYTRGQLLHYRLEQQTMLGLLPELERFLEYCTETADNPANSLLTVRYAENLLSAYYHAAGDSLQASIHLVSARDAYMPEGMEKIPSDPLLYSNMLKLYTQLNDIDQMLELMDRLDDLQDTYKDDTYLVDEISTTIQQARNKLGIPFDDPDDSISQIDFLMNVWQQIHSNSLIPEPNATRNVAYFLRIASIIATITDEATPTHDEFLKMRDILQYFLDNPQIYPLSIPKEMTAYGLLATIFWRINSPLAMEYIELCLARRHSLVKSNESRITVLRFASTIYFCNGLCEPALETAEEALSCITDAWQKATSYLDDRKICQILLMSQDNFMCCCAVFRKLLDSEAFYDRILRFKDLPALVGRERNRILRLAPVDPVLQEEIFHLQDQLAALEMSDVDSDPQSKEILLEQLQEKEAYFAAQFPQNVSFTPISFRRMCEHLPKGSAVADFYFSPDSSKLRQTHVTQEDFVLDLFLTVNRDGTPRLIHLTLSDGRKIINDAANFISLLQNSGNFFAGPKKEILRKKLYRSLIAPMYEHLEGISTLYLAPDGILCNLPLEILQLPNNRLLQDRFRILRLVSGRDLLFSDEDAPASGGAFILGNPDFDTSRGILRHRSPYTREDADFTRGIIDRISPVHSIPFSGIEAQRIARRFRCTPYCGSQATKYALQQALPSKVIHLSTHGIFDEYSDFSNSLYSSYLVFAGFNRWLENKQDVPFCGNGILTADEISRMNLSGTQLVVLSACQSGLGSNEYSSMQGLLSAFSAAGVRWVISHMWHASDIAATILMDTFYKAHLTDGLDVPDALSYAKNYLRNVTVGQLRRDGWIRDFFAIDDENARKQAERINNCRDGDKIFANELYWGGFVCHRCN